MREKRGNLLGHRCSQLSALENTGHKNRAPKRGKGNLFPGDNAGAWHRLIVPRGAGRGSGMGGAAGQGGVGRRDERGELDKRPALSEQRQHPPRVMSCAGGPADPRGCGSPWGVALPASCSPPPPTHPRPALPKHSELIAILQALDSSRYYLRD